MNTRATVLACALAMPTALAGTAFAGSNKVAQQDAYWLKNIHQTSLAAIKAGKTAQRNGNSPLVDKVARKIIDDDQVLDKKVKMLAKDEGVNLPNSPSTKQQSELQTVKSKHGTEFDKLWTRTMLKAELKAGNQAQAEVAKGKSQKVKKLAKTALPAINLEQNMLQHAIAKLKSTTKTSISK
ncbi:MAG TPA: DUF4142 domain-containing protein [Gammaproteobacteria bacterium]|nr:DUF4142 domain-containing protein [Gammaproteobacteria bacterium]